jgi:ZIP family zinc transporter
MPVSMQAPLLFALLAATVATLGLIAVGTWRRLDQRLASLLGVAAAGLLLMTSFFHLLPEALSRSALAPGLMAGGFLFGVMLTYGFKAVSGKPAVASAVPDRADALAAVVAIGLHSLIDGMIYSVTFAADFSSGVFASLGLILHEFPEGIIAFAILRQAGVAPRRALVYAFLAAAFTTPLGVVLSSPVIQLIGIDMLGLCFAASVGLVLYVATGPLLAPMRHLPPRSGLMALLSGVAIGLVLLSSPLHQGHRVPGDAAAGPDHHLRD